MTHRLAEDHVAVAVAIGSGAEIRAVRSGERGNQLGCVGRVRIGMVTAEIRLGLRVHGGSGRRAEAALQDFDRIRAGHRVHRIEPEPETAVEQLARYTGLETTFIDRTDLRIRDQHFFKELLRDQRRTVANDVRVRAAAERVADIASEGMQPATTLSTNAALHSWPLAEWIVDRQR